jgi:hypothetical protein
MYLDEKNHRVGYESSYSEINLQQNKGIRFLYCKQNRHFYLDLSSEKYGTPLLY